MHCGRGRFKRYHVTTDYYTGTTTPPHLERPCPIFCRQRGPRLACDKVIKEALYVSEYCPRIPGELRLTKQVRHSIGGRTEWRVNAPKAPLLEGRRSP